MDYQQTIKLKKLWDQLGVPDSREPNSELLQQLFDEHLNLLRDSIRLVSSAIASRKELSYRTQETLRPRISRIEFDLQLFGPGIGYSHIEARHSHLESELRQLTENLHEEQRLALRDLTYLYMKLLYLRYQYRSSQVAAALIRGGGPPSASCLLYTSPSPRD